MPCFLTIQSQSICNWSIQIYLLPSVVNSQNKTSCLSCDWSIKLGFVLLFANNIKWKQHFQDNLIIFCKLRKICLKKHQPTVKACNTQYARPPKLAIPNTPDHHSLKYPIHQTTKAWYTQYARPLKLDTQYARPPRPNMSNMPDHHSLIYPICQTTKAWYTQYARPLKLDTQYARPPRPNMSNMPDHQSLIYPIR